ncbi:MAG: Mrp/NBP35 family ATP-binding protein [Acidimicrobiales bacterium]
MSVNEDQLRQAVGRVVDPELRRPLSELGMLHDLDIRRGRVRATVAVPTDSYPKADELSGLVTSAISGMEGVKGTDVSLVVMDDAMRADLVEVLEAINTGAASSPQAPGPAPGGTQAPGSDHAHGPGHAPPGQRPNPFMRPDSPTRVLGISSGKGGVGKSSVTVNLAITLSQRGHKVSVLDADVYGFSIPRMLGIDRSPLVIDKLLVPPVAYGVACMSMGFFVREDQPVVWRGPMLHKALEQFMVDTWWGEPDYLVVDMPPGTGDVALSMAQYMPKSEVFVVTTPQVAAQRVAQRTGYMSRQLKLPLRGVIENMSYFTGNDGVRYEIFGSGGGHGVADDLGVPLLGQVPLVEAVRVGGDRGLPITVSEPDGPSAWVFGHIAAQIEAMGPARVYRSELKVR